MKKVYLKVEEVQQLFNKGRTTIYEKWMKDETLLKSFVEFTSAGQRIVFDQDLYETFLDNSNSDKYDENISLLKQTVQNIIQISSVHSSNNSGQNLNNPEYNSGQNSNMFNNPNNSLNINEFVNGLVQRMEVLAVKAGEAKQVPLLTDNIISNQNLITTLRGDAKHWEDKYFEVDNECKMLQKSNTELSVKCSEQEKTIKDLTEKVKIYESKWWNKSIIKK